MFQEQSLDICYICKECENKVENVFEYKNLLQQTRNTSLQKLSECKAHIEEIVQDTSVCYLCKNTFQSGSAINLTESLRDINLNGVFEQHFPDIVSTSYNCFVYIILFIDITVVTNNLYMSYILIWS